MFRLIIRACLPVLLLPGLAAASLSEWFERNFSITPGKEVQKAVQGRRGEVGWRG